MENRPDLQQLLQNRQRHLDELGRCQRVLRDYVRGVATGRTTGLYLFGPPGTGKTHAVRGVLEREVQEIYCYQPGHLAPGGLFELIAEHPEEIIVLDDLAVLFKSDVALQILLAALAAPDRRGGGRTVKYKRRDGEQRVHFRGGIICISNKELHDDDLLDAFKSRVHVLHYAPSDAQLAALMLDIASRGWSADGGEVLTVSPAEAQVVTEHVLAEALRLGCRLDLRLLTNKAFPDFQQCKDGEAESDWRDLVPASIQQYLFAPRHDGEDNAGRDSRLAEERRIASEIARDHPTREGRLKAWAERTGGKSERAFYRRLAETR